MKGSSNTRNRERVSLYFHFASNGLLKFWPFLHTFESLRKFKKACCGKKLKPNAIQIINEFDKNFTVLHEQFKLTVINKIHIIVTHVPEYIKETKHSLGQNSDQLIEA